jgi:hypothetical protein
VAGGPGWGPSSFCGARMDRRGCGARLGKHATVGHFARMMLDILALGTTLTARESDQEEAQAMALCGRGWRRFAGLDQNLDSDPIPAKKVTKCPYPGCISSYYDWPQVAASRNRLHNTHQMSVTIRRGTQSYDDAGTFASNCRTRTSPLSYPIQSDTDSISSDGGE